LESWMHICHTESQLLAFKPKKQELSLKKIRVLPIYCR
jgi:hypothetical protein